MAVQAASEGWMAPDQVEALLGAYRIPVPRGGLATDAEAALAMAEAVGYPVVLKLAAPGVTHKTEVGGVRLDIRGPEQLRSEFEALVSADTSPTEVSSILRKLRTHRPSSNSNGLRSEEPRVYVQRMVKGMAQLIVGLTRDPQFGPLAMVGTGGTEVELKRDVAFELAPMSAKQADDTLDRTAAGKLLAGFRGTPPADRAAVVDVILRLSQIVLDWPEIAEIEVNPLIVTQQGVSVGPTVAAVDARVRRCNRNEE